ncbi:hypothetical protein IAU60_004187 [Kwoniella sp. DSM 27419]
MLHRRPNAPSGSPAGPPSTSPGPGQGPRRDSAGNVNKAYTPLRRQSSGLYPGGGATQSPSGGPRARYAIPQPSPGLGGGGALGLSPGYGPGLGVAPNGLTYGLAGGIADDWPGAGLSSAHPSGVGSGSAADWMMAVRSALESTAAGTRDAVKLDRSWALVSGDRELRTLVLKSTMINLLSLLLLSLSSIVFSPLLVHPVSATMEVRTKEIGMWYNILLSWPVFVVCFWVNASWGPSISRRAQATLHPSHRFQPSPSSTPSTSGPGSASASSTPYSWIASSVSRLLLISDFTLLSRLIGLMPFVGGMGAFAYMCVIDAYYCFEWNFSNKQWPLDYRVRYMQDRTAYMLGFGLPATFLTSFGPPLVKMAVFALIYPFFVLQAIQARPPGARATSSLLPATPSPHASLPPSPTGGTQLNLNDPFFAPSKSPSSTSFGSIRIMGRDIPIHFRLRLPIFFFASYALDGVKWLEQAAARDRSGSFSAGAAGGPLGPYGQVAGGPGFGGVTGLGRERPGKRAF